MDKLFIRGLAVLAVIGVYDHEKTKPQPILLDIEMKIDAATAAVSDDIVETVDYAAIYHYLRDYIPTTRFQLLETLADQVSRGLIQKFSLSWLRLTVTKQPSDLPGIAGAGVTIERKVMSAGFKM